MKTEALKHFAKNTLATFIFSMSLLFVSAEGNKDSNTNTLSYDLGNAEVSIEYLNESISDNKESIAELNPAIINLSKNMTVNGDHLNKGEYKVVLKESQSGLTLSFQSTANDDEALTVQLDSKMGEHSDFINYSLWIIENDKLQGEINYDGKDYTFTMEVSLSNKIFSYLEREELENSSDWLDYYQAGIYAYKNNIDLDKSYKYAEKALQAGQNEYTIELSLLYLEALGRDTEAQQLSALK